MKTVLLSLIALLCLSKVTLAAYVLQEAHQGDKFFDGWTFETAGDPTHGYVNYVDEAQARRDGLISTNASWVHIGADYKKQGSGRGRDSVRVHSKSTFNHGLFIIDLSHMPTGCGTWPAWWTVGPNWPNNGEIDVIEGVNEEDHDQVTLHTNAGCTMQGTPTNTYSGKLGNANCQGNSGCGIETNAGTYGAPFNSHSGGVFALEWTATYLKSFYWPRTNIPADITADKPNPSSWGLPFAYFQLGNNCPASHFQNHNMVIDLTFCGDWAGAVFGSQCPGKGNCNDYVKNNPGAFKEAFWTIHYIKVFQNQ